MNKKYWFAFFYVFLMVIMIVFQYYLDASRSISKHCLIRNFTLLTLLLLLYKKKISLFFGGFIAILVEVVLETLHQVGYSLDPYSYKSMNCNRWLDTLREKDYIDISKSEYEGDVLQKKYKWMSENCLLDSNSAVLEVGCGNGDFLHYLRNVVKCKKVVGLAYSQEQQSYVSNRGFECVLSTIYDIPESFYGKFDAIIYNGSMENFINNTERNIETIPQYSRLFEKLSKCLNPNSNKKRVVVTCIHLHRKLAPYEFLQGYLLNRSYGIQYSVGIDDYVNNAKTNGLDLIREENHTKGYYIISKKMWFNIISGLQDIKRSIKLVLDVPVLALNDPYYFHKVFHLSIQSWPGQFDCPYFSWPMAYNDTPLSYYKWLVFTGKNDSFSKVK